MANLKLCVWQPQVKSVTASVSERMAALDAAAKTASTAQAQLLITPEMYAAGYNIGAVRIAESAERLQGSILTQAADIAKHYGIALLLGFPELAEDGRIYNSVAFVDEQGVLLNIYRKTHLYGDVDRTQFSAGQALGVPFKFQGWVLASAICYDIEFPEVARHYDLGQKIKLGQGEIKSGGVNKSSVLADAVEAIFGAVLLDKGYLQAQSFVSEVMRPWLTKVDPSVIKKDPKSHLQEVLQKQGLALPVYKTIKEEEVKDNIVFTVSCSVSEKDLLVKSKASSRKKAEQSCAEKLVVLLNE